VWSGSVIGLQSAAITVAFGEPIRGASGETRGYLITAFYPERVIQVLRPDYPRDARLVLIDETGRVIYDSGRIEPAAAEIDVSGAPGVRDALAGKTRWVGVMGNPRHPAPHIPALAALGVAETDIGRVHRPIGLNIGSHTPAEIALATLAGLIADRNGRSGGFEF